MTLYDLAQLVIALLGVPAVVLSQLRHHPKLQRYAPILGLAGQPAWFYFTWTAVPFAWGAFAMCFLYSGAWGIGLWYYWIKPSKFVTRIRMELALMQARETFERAAGQAGYWERRDVSMTDEAAFNVPAGISCRACYDREGGCVYCKR